MESDSLDIIHLFKQADEKHSIKQMFRHWLSKKQLEDGENMYGVHYMEAVSDPKKRQAVLKKLSPQAYALVSVLRNCKGLRYKADPENPDSPLAMHDYGVRENCVMRCYELQLHAGAYTVGLDTSHISELHYYGVAFFTDPSLWPPGVFSKTHLEADIILAPFFDKDDIPLPDSRIDNLEPYELPQNINPEFSGKMCRWLDSFMSLAEKGCLRYSNLNHFYAFSRDMLEKHFSGVKDRDLLFEYLLRFGMDNKILCMDSSGVIAPGPNLAKFRLLPLGAQMKLYFEWRNTCPSFWRGEKRYDHIECLELYLVHIYSRLLKEFAGKWLSVDEVLSTMALEVRDCFSMGKCKKDWEWKDIVLGEFTVPQLREIFDHELKQRFFIPGLTYHVTTEDGREFVTLTELGEAIIGDAPIPSYDDSKIQLLVKNDFEIVLINSGRWDYVRYFLSLFMDMDPKSNHASSLFYLKQKNIRDAASLGRPVSMLIDFLKKYATAPIPENVLTTLKDWVMGEVTLHKDACFFAFDRPEDAKRLLQKYPRSFSLMGNNMLLCYMSDDNIMKLMNSNRIAAVDYSIPVTGTITVTRDNEVIFSHSNDFRIRALGLEIADETTDEKGRKRYFLSHDKLAAIQNPKIFYQRLSRLFSSDTDMVMKLRIMRGMGLFTSRGSVTVLMNCPTQTKQQLQRHISWYRNFSAQVGLGQFVVKEESLAEVRQAMTKITDKRAVLQTFQL
ncbi:hypothetical protein J6T93_02925 [bacterium]|nr:hypothetical protein [bacterium]